MKDYYKILNLDKDCTEEEIKKNYKLLAIKNHPDKGGNEDTFKNISEAYQILSNPEKKREYDNNNNVNNLNSMINAEQLFQAFFNRNNNNLFNYKESFSRGQSNINLNNLFNQMNINQININENSFNNMSISESRQIYVVGNKRLEKIIQNKNGQKIEIIIETDLTTGERKQKLRQIR